MVKRPVERVIGKDKLLRKLIVESTGGYKMIGFFNASIS